MLNIINGPDGPIVFYTNSNGYVVSIIGVGGEVDTSPVVITPNEPIGPISSIDFGTLYQRLLVLIQG